jgi:hypothetical protein
VKPWLAALMFLAGVVGSLYSLFVLMGLEGDAYYLVMHVTSYALMLAGFDRLVRKS